VGTTPLSRFTQAGIDPIAGTNGLEKTAGYFLSGPIHELAHGNIYIVAVKPIKIAWG